jgi:adenosylmethionine-8-amino-7-oxononanoate aminotransferase
VRVEHRPGHYHGATLGALGVTGWRARRAPYDALLGAGATGSAGVGGAATGDGGPEPGSPTGDLAAVILETIPGAGLGAPAPASGDLAALRARCDAAGALWIADEVLTGFGRVGALFAWQRLGEGEAGRRTGPVPTPDLVAFGKGAGAGFAPLAGVLVCDRVAQTLDAAGFTHHQTYGGNPIACAVGRRMLAALAEERIYARVREHEGALESTLRARIASTQDVGVRGLGFLWSVVLAERCGADIPASCPAAGVLVHPGKGSDAGEASDFILVAPPLTAGPDAFAEIARAIGAAVAGAGAGSVAYGRSRRA